MAFKNFQKRCHICSPNDLDILARKFVAEIFQKIAQYGHTDYYSAQTFKVLPNVTVDWRINKSQE